jgi:hypothetical protein
MTTNVMEFPNSINTVTIKFRQLADKPDVVEYWVITQEPTGTNRKLTKFDSRTVANFDPYVHWIDNRYFIISTGSRFGVNPRECKDKDINWSQDMKIYHDIYRMPEYGLNSGIAWMPEHLTSIPDLYPGSGDSNYSYKVESLGYEIIPPSPNPYRRTEYEPERRNGEGASTVEKPKVLAPHFCRIYGYWIYTTDKPYSRKLQDELHATYSIRNMPSNEYYNVYKFAPENPENPDYKDSEAVAAATAMKVATKIQNYLTPKSRPYHEAITALLGNILASAKLHGFIFGGYILGLIEHYAEYQKNPSETEYKPPNDIDVWFSDNDLPSGCGCYSRSGLEWYILKNIKAYLIASGRKYKYLYEKDEEHLRLYSVAKLLIDNTYRFDLVCNVNNGCKFDSLADFSATNLYYKLGGDGELKLRTVCGGFNLEQVLGHIRDRELHPVVEFQKLNRFVRDQYEYDWYQKKFVAREQKMLEKGYVYPSGVVSLSDLYVPGMAEKLEQIKKLNEPKYHLADGEEPPK